MATARAMLERRRSSRVQTSIPVTIVRSESNDQPSAAAAEAVSVSRCGALIRLPFLPELGSRIKIQHGLSQEVRDFRVISLRGQQEGFFNLGVEILYPNRNFWGIQFPDERHPR